MSVLARKKKNTVPNKDKLRAGSPARRARNNRRDCRFQHIYALTLASGVLPFINCTDSVRLLSSLSCETGS